MVQQKKRFYLTKVEGCNFQFWGEPEKMGFMTALLIEAPDAEAAKGLAFSTIRNDQRFAGRVINAPGDGPVVHVEITREFEERPTDDAPYGSLIYYPDDRFKAN
jgi:hypothetical protein